MVRTFKGLAWFVACLLIAFAGGFVWGRLRPPSAEQAGALLALNENLKPKQAGAIVRLKEPCPAMLLRPEPSNFIWEAYELHANAPTARATAHLQCLGRSQCARGATREL